MPDKRIALVTGANQGVGLQVAKELVANGVTVLVGARNFERGQGDRAGRDRAPTRRDRPGFDCRSGGAHSREVRPPRPGMFYADIGAELVSNLYNLSAKLHGGKVEAVYTSKRRQDCETGMCVFDIERGVADGILPHAWQTDTCVGNWHYKRGIKYKTLKGVIDMLCDIVSRNGNLMLNFPLPNNGELDAEELKILDEITRWMAVNSEGIYGTRPWKTFGAGPSIVSAPVTNTRFNESNRKDLTPDDIRFTTKGNTLYAFVMGWPGRQASLPALAAGGKYEVPKIHNVDLLGHKGKLKWRQDSAALTVELPEQKPSGHAVCFRVALA